MSKSVTASRAIQKMNADINIIALEKKVCTQTEADTFHDAFFGRLDLCVNALDNIEARRYMDNRCVAQKKPLLETGTLGAKGHVQVIVPYITESYNSQRDPNESDSEIPYCTLKSFPANIEHCIQWARDKFESNFRLKPDAF
jgi:ubiquitin-activating enzyme E1-like protein 2